MQTTSQPDDYLAPVREQCLEGMREFGVPYHMHDGLLRYLMQGIAPGSFLTAVIVGDLYGALGRADDININALRSYGMFFYNIAPANSYGSERAMADWLESGGIEGQRGAAA